MQWVQQVGQAEQTCQWLNYIRLIGFYPESPSVISNQWPYPVIEKVEIDEAIANNMSSERTRLTFVFYAQTLELSITTRKPDQASHVVTRSAYVF